MHGTYIHDNWRVLGEESKCTQGLHETNTFFTRRVLGTAWRVLGTARGAIHRAILS